MKDVKSKTKRLLALLLAVVMVFSSVPNVTTYFANTENSGSEGGEGGSESEAEKNNAAVSIKLTDSYNGDAITGDITVKYALLKGSETLTEDTEWTTVNDSLNEEGVITVLKEKSISISDTKLYVQVEKENYIAYQSTAIELREYDENSTPDSVEFELDMELLKGINHDYDGNAIPVAEINSVWETLLNADGIIVSYALKCDGEDIELEDISMMPEVKDAGTYELTITVSKQDGSEAEWTQAVTSKIIKASIENVSIKAKDDLVYGGIEQELVKLIGTGLQTGDTITWYVKSANENDEKYEEVASYSYAEDEDIELPKMTDAGNYTVKIVVQRENYNDYTQVVENIQIHPGKIDLGEITITGYGGAYDGKEHDAVKVESEREYAYTLQYQLHECTSENCDHLTIDEDAWQDECPKVKDAGSYIVWVKAVVDDSNYEDTDVSVEKAENAVAPFNVYIEKYTPEISFIEDEFNKETSSSKVTKTDLGNGMEYVFGAAYVGDVQPSENITYSVLKQATEGEFVEDETATIDDTGKLIAKEEGVYQITASSVGNENFEASSIAHTLYVGVEAGTDAEDKLITFEDSQVDYIFNINSTSISDFTAEKTYATDNGTVTYSIDKTLEGAIAIDSSTGEVKVLNYEKLKDSINEANDKTIALTVTATKAVANYSGTGNVQYGADSASYEITLEFLGTPANPYKITGTINEENNWYSTKVTLTAPDDYTISKSLENFAESVTYDEQGVLENSYVYLMDEEGYITAPILVQNEDGTNFQIDTVDPGTVTVKYSDPTELEKLLEKIFRFYQSSVELTFTSTDETSGVDYFAWKYIREDDASSSNVASDEDWNKAAAEWDEDTKQYTATITLSASEADQYRGHIVVHAVDKAENKSAETDDAGRIFVIDTISPKMQVNYPNPKKESEDGSIKYYHEDVEITFSVEEVNFFNENVKVSVSKDGFEAQPVTVEWTSNGDNHIGTYTLTGAGDYVVYVEYSDYSGNVMKDENEVEIKQYQSHIITIDTKNPEVKMEFDKGTQTTTFTIEEHNFDPTKITVTGERKDLNGKELDFAAVKLQEILQNAEWTKNGDIYTYTYDYKKDGESFDGIYNLTINCTDLSGRAAKTYKPGTFTIDRCKPTDVEITYSDPLKETFIKKIIENIMETITLGFYNPDVTITLTTYDAYSDVKYFEWKHTRQDRVSEDNRPTDTEFTVIEAVPDREDKTKFTATFNLPESEAEQIRGWLAVKATDNYKNESNLANDDKKILVVDTVSPTIQVEYTPADRVVGTTSYYNNNVDIIFTVDEANFFAEDVVVKVSKDGREAVDLATSWTSQSTDIHIGTAQLSGDGDYVITVEYKDRSYKEGTKNEGVKYTSNVHTIDTITPVIKVEYQNTDVVNTLGDRDDHSRNYFTGTQTAVVTITEHNFNAEDVVWMLTATDVTGKELDINSLHVKGAWEDGTEEDTHTFTIIYPGDANYTFDVAYADLATNEAADYATDYFTVDNTAPVNLKVDYSTSLLETILETITFGFYNATVEVTLTAEDVISGVHGFVYNYTNASDVSDVNAELLAQAIEAAEITYSNEGQTAVVKFNIPKAVLGNTNQFNGTISFETTDRSGIKSLFADEKRIVVDNIAPTAQITYNQPVNTEGSISYYAGDITATVVINEANFYAEDVVVMVTKDGGTATAITPSWVDNSVDVHTGTFTLTEDGDYFITINYQDKSTNQMAQYTSDQLTIDTDIQAPVISFNGNNENGHAYKGEVVPSISFSDINYDSYEVHLYRTYKGALNVEITEEKGLMDMFSVGEQDGNASFDIFAVDENGKYKAEDDGIYHLTITMNDKAGHQINSEAYFTVNRYGSVYEYGEYLVSLISDGGAFKQEITEDLTITEYNADRLVGNSLNIEITRDGKPLDTVEYTVTPEINEHVAVGESGWFQYQYTISKNNFVQDGIYKISVSSKDATGNAPENSNFEDKNILFYVDSTVPEITSITGLEESIVDNTELTIRYMIFDTMALKSVTVYVDGEVLDEITDFSSDLNNYEGEFTLQESEEQRSIRIVAEDKAGNITDTASEDFTSAYVFNAKVIVTTNAFVRFFANKPLFYGSIAGVVGIAGLAGFGISRRYRKKQSSI